ncbi:MAG: tetratricopeptide repeat protein [Candidatus Omnitrophica bacterium]|jgi:tetratricopeptide (TPR) repeat protein|nr:tetratricopeptide repeat protein [Candidatus Omnitrophota bacterium]
MGNNNPARPAKRLKTRIFLVISGVFLSFILLEMGLRVSGFIFSACQEFRNRSALRGNGVYKILCLGASTTARQYPKPLEAILNERNTGIRFKVIDKGVIATDTDGILSQLEKNLDIYRPNMVITMMGYNDNRIMYYKDIPDSDNGLFRNSRAYRLFRLIYTYVLKKLKKEDVYGLDLSVAPIRRFGMGYTSLGGHYCEQGDLVKAEQAYKKAIESDLDKDEAYVGLGRIYFKQGNWADAEKVYKKAIELNPRNDKALSWMGKMFNDQNKLVESAGLLQRAIRVNPKNWEAYVDLGCVYRKQRYFNGAEKCFVKALDLRPYNEWVCSELVEIYKYQGNFQQAEKMLKEYVERNPGNDWGYKILGYLYKEMGMTKCAEECNRKLREFNKKEYAPRTIRNYNKLKDILEARNIRLVCMQYPMRSLGPLKEIFKDTGGMIFVDNRRVFAEAIERDGYKTYFLDMFGGDFGHCTPQGCRLMAENIAGVVLKELRVK